MTAREKRISRIVGDQGDEEGTWEQSAVILTSALLEELSGAGRNGRKPLTSREAKLQGHVSSWKRFDDMHEVQKTRDAATWHKIDEARRRITVRVMNGDYEGASG